MRIQRRSSRAAGLVLAGALAAGGLVVATAASAAPAAAPPWQQTTNKYNDPDDVGTLAFYNSAGKQIYSGSTTAQPFAAFIAGSATTSASDTLATLYAYTPTSGVNAGGWSGEQLSAASSYPDASAPGALKTVSPLEAGSGADTPLSDLVNAFPNTSTATGYSGIYELRLRTSGPGTVASATYDSADVEVTGTSWQVVYPQHFKDSTTKLSLTPKTGLKVGGKATLKATVTTGATGKVNFSEGTTSLGSATLSSGTASKTVTIPRAGKATFKATFVPGTSSAYGGSSGTAKATVAKATSKTTDSVSPKKIAKTKQAKLTATVKASGVTPGGTVTVFDGSKKIATGTLAKGKATITLPKLKAGKHKLHAAYAGSSTVAGSTGPTVTLTVTG